MGALIGSFMESLLGLLTGLLWSGNIFGPVRGQTLSTKANVSNFGTFFAILSLLHNIIKPFLSLYWMFLASIWWAKCKNQLIRNDFLNKICKSARSKQNKCCRMMSTNVAKWCHHIATFGPRSRHHFQNCHYLLALLFRYIWWFPSTN